MVAAALDAHNEHDDGPRHAVIEKYSSKRAPRSRQRRRGEDEPSLKWQRRHVRPEMCAKVCAPPF